MSHYADYENQTDYQLGTLLLADWIKKQAIAAGVEVTRAFSEQMVAIAQTVTGKATNAGLAQALHKAAKGDFEGAGADLRQLLEAGVESELKARQTANELDAVDAELANTQAVVAALHPLAMDGLARKEVAAQNSKAGSDAMKLRGEETKATVLAAGNKILQELTSSISGNNLADKIARRTGLPKSTCNSYVKALRKEGKLLDKTA